MNGCPPSDLVLNSLLGAKAATRWAERLRTQFGSTLGDNIRFEDASVLFAVNFPQGAPSDYQQKSDASSSAARCLDVVAATRATPQEVLRRIDDDLTSVAVHAWTTATAAGFSEDVETVLAMTATPWSPARVVAHRRMSKAVFDITPAGWADVAPRAALVSSYRTGPPGWRITPAAARICVDGLEAMTLLRRSAAGAVACTSAHRWTMRGDEVWRKPSDARRISR
jgi:hypothetical protein